MTPQLLWHYPDVGPKQSLNAQALSICDGVEKNIVSLLNTDVVSHALRPLYNLAQAVML